MVYYQSPDLCLAGAITAIYQVAVFISGDGPVLQHIVDLLPDPVVVLARETVPESFLRGLEFLAWHIPINISTVLIGETSTASLIGR